MFSIYFSVKEEEEEEGDRHGFSTEGVEREQRNGKGGVSENGERQSNE